MDDVEGSLSRVRLVKHIFQKVPLRQPRGQDQTRRAWLKAAAGRPRAPSELPRKSLIFLNRVLQRQTSCLARRRNPRAADLFETKRVPGLDNAGLAVFSSGLHSIRNCVTQRPSHRLCNGLRAGLNAVSSGFDVACHYDQQCSVGVFKCAQTNRNTQIPVYAYRPAQSRHLCGREA